MLYTWVDTWPPLRALASAWLLPRGSPWSSSASAAISTRQRAWNISSAPASLPLLLPLLLLLCPSATNLALAPFLGLGRALALLLLLWPSSGISPRGPNLWRQASSSLEQQPTDHASLTWQAPSASSASLTDTCSQ
jgi:hypothetical protein